MSELIRSLLGAKRARSKLAVSAIIYGETAPLGLTELKRRVEAHGGELDFEIIHVHAGEDTRAALLAAKHELVICAEPEVWLDFAERALRLLTHTEVDLVVSSKLLPGASTQLPLLRRGGRRFYHYLLRRTVGLGGTDTLGSKAFRRSRLAPILEQCRTTGDAFASELVIRAQRAGLDVREMAEQSLGPCETSTAWLWHAPALLGAVVKLRRTLGRRT